MTDGFMNWTKKIYREGKMLFSKTVQLSEFPTVVECLNLIKDTDNWKLYSKEYGLISFADKNNGDAFINFEMEDGDNSDN